ncbi:MAG: cation transporter [Chloroflexi bacterium]|nr:cation transporter [Chloroflexota bacterium]
MSHNHEHNHISESSRSRLKIVLGIITFIMVVEVVGGILSNSLALIGDAGHMLVDALAIALSLFAITMAARPATLSKTFGYHRVEIMAALANGVTLVLVAAYVFYEAYQRFLEPPVVRAPLMMGVATIGLVSNLAGMFLLKGVSHHSLNIKAAFWHIIGDTVSSVGVVAGGVIIAITGWGVVDPIIAVLIGCIILVGAVSLVRESVDILLEAVPKHIAVDEVIKSLKAVPGVDEVHDVHVWTLTSDIHALSAHLMIQDQSVSGSAEIVDKVNHNLSEQFNITHTTLQLECERCATCPEGTVCNIIRPEEPEKRAERI